MSKRSAVLFLGIGLVLLAAGWGRSAGADERLAGIACRSVHLGYPAPEGFAFYNELTVDQSAPGTYFMACGFNLGYFGIQELPDGKKLVIFSVWDPGAQDDPNQVDPEKRVKLLFRGEGVRVGRFGNEGTGGQSFFDYDWKLGTTYRFFVTARPDGERTEFGGYLFVPEQNSWKHLVTFSTLSEGRGLRGCYSFIEDFQRNRVSTTQVRRARFGNGWIQKSDGEWIALTQARFTADSNPVVNINAGLAGDRFFLVTGGETTNSDTPLRELIRRPPAGLDLPKTTE
ncbi:MAG: DUF3472 domain-containing protein [Planctomycetales bacterium]